MMSSTDRVVARHQSNRLTYDELDRQSNALARGLQSISVQKGDRVAVMLGNSLEYATVCEGDGPLKLHNFLTSKTLS